jgi:hypothetical protein
MPVSKWPRFVKETMQLLSYTNWDDGGEQFVTDFV